MSEITPPPPNQDKPTLTPYLTDLPADVQWLVNNVWEKVPAAQRDQLLALLPYIPSDDIAGLRKIFELAQANYHMAFGSKTKVAIVGPANVGKSTLYNQFVALQTDKAEVSPIPGTTKVNQTADAGPFLIVDTPGADAVGMSGDREREFAFAAAQEADFLIIIFDALQGIKQTEQALFMDLRRLDKPYVVVLNKMDMVGHKWLKRGDRQEVINHCAHHLGISADQIIPISAEKGENLGRILQAIITVEPGLLAALGQALPRYRARLAWQAIIRAASTSAAIALTPIPMLDFFPLVAIQATMVLAIARIYNYELTWQRSQELVASLGLGYAGRMLFQELSKFGGPPGWVLSASVAASTTVVIGYSSIVWFSTGRKITSELAGRLLKAVTGRLVDRFKLWGEKPSKEALVDELTTIIEGEQSQLFANNPDSSFKQ